MATRYRCVDCHKVRNGTPGKTRWCDCGGELRPLRYGPKKRRATRD